MMRRYLLIPAMLLFSSCASSNGAAPLMTYSPPDPANWAHDIYWASHAARGGGFCDEELAEEFQSRFDRRYGPRMRDLREGYEVRFGPPADFVIVGGCRRVTDSGQSDRIRQRRALAEFESWLDVAERALADALIDSGEAPTPQPRQ